MKRASTWVLLVGLVLLMAPSTSAQEAAEKAHVYAISTYKVQFQNVDKVLKTWEEMWKPVYTKNEHVKGLWVFTHFWGSDWSIVVIAEYENLAGIEAALKRGEEIRKELFPDEEKWQASLAEVQGMFLGHFDDIVTEVPSLEK